MAQLNLDTGIPGDINTGEDLNASLVKTEANFTDLYSITGDLGTDKLESIVAGTNITINNADPLNPVISSTGGGGGITLDLVPIDGSTNGVESNGVYDELAKRPLLDDVNFFTEDNTFGGTNIILEDSTQIAFLGNLNSPSWDTTIKVNALSDFLIHNVYSAKTLALKGNGDLEYLGFTNLVDEMMIISSEGVISTQTIPAGGGSNQTLSIVGDQLTISGENTVTLPDNDSQTISRNGSEITITNGNTIDLTSTLTGNVTLNGLSSSRTGTYKSKKTGDNVTVRFDISSINATSGTPMTITGLPYVADGAFYCELFVTPDADVDANEIGSWMGVLTGTTISIYYKEVGSLQMQPVSHDFATDGYIRGTINYFI